MYQNNTIGERMVSKWIKDGHYEITNHALQRMGERKIDIEDVIQCIAEGKILETQNTDDGFKILYLKTKDKKAFYVVVLVQFPPRIITVCWCEEEVWECTSKMCKRRKK